MDPEGPLPLARTAHTTPKPRSSTRNVASNIVVFAVSLAHRAIVFVPDWVTNVLWEEPAIARFLTRLRSIGRLISFEKRGAGISDSVPLDALPTRVGDRLPPHP